MPIDHRTDDLAEMELPELEAALEALGRAALPRAARSSSGSTTAASPTSPAMTDLGRELRAELAARFRDRARPTMVAPETSTDGTTKFLLRLDDGKLIESVYIPRHAGADTFCISTQVGCAMTLRLLPDRQDGHRSAT